jgi:hypothetical protein
MKVLYNKQSNSIAPFYLFVVIFLVVTLFTWNYPAQVDAISARNTYISLERNDLFGAFPTWYFGNLPNTFFSWQQISRIIQLFIVGISGLLILFIPKFRNWKTILGYATFALFASNVNRDGFSLSFALLGTVSFLLISQVQQNRIILMLKTVSIICFIICALMRPYFCFISLPILLIVCRTNKNVFRIFILSAVLAIPIGVNTLIAITGDFKKAFPSQQPMAQDLTYMACQTNNASLQEKAFTVMNQANPDLQRSDLCAASSIHSGFLISGDPWKEVPPVFKLFKESERAQFYKFRSSYFKLIISRPDIYVKSKVHNLIEMSSAKGQLQHLTEGSESLKSSRQRIAKLLSLVDKIGLLTPTLGIILLVINYSRRGVGSFEQFWRNPMFQVGTLSLIGFSLIYIGAIGRYGYIAAAMYWLTYVSMKKDSLSINSSKIRHGL